MFFVRRKHNKKIHLFTAVAFAVGAMIGGGVFVLSGTALKQTGPSALVSFALAGFTVMLSALSFAVVGAQASSHNPGYTFVGKMLGSKLWSFLTSWCFYLAGIIGAAFVLNAFGIYVNEFIDAHVSILAWSLFGALILTLVNLGPASEIGRIESLLVSGKLLVLLLLIGFGLASFHAKYITPFTPHGSSQIFVTSTFLFIAFLGFNVITNIAGDIDKPSKTVPKAILLSMGIVTLVYVGVIFALLSGNIHSYSESSVGVAAQHLMGPIGGVLVVISALASTLSSANANILGSSELMVRMAAQREVPTILGHMRHGHPYISVLAGAVFYAILLISHQTQLVINLANVMAIVALIIVDVAAVKALRSGVKLPVRLPFGWFLPAIGALGAVSQFFFMPRSSLLISLGLILVGIALYWQREVFHIKSLHKDIVKVVDELEGPLTRALKR